MALLLLLLLPEDIPGRQWGSMLVKLVRKKQRSAFGYRLQPCRDPVAENLLGAV